MKRGLLLAVAVAVGVFLYVQLLVKPAETEYASPVAQKQVSRMAFRGRLEPVGGTLNVGGFSQSANTVLGSLFVAAGDRVKAGQVIAELDTAGLLRAEIRAAEIEVELARRKLEYIRKPYREGAAAALQAVANVRRIDVDLAADQLKRRDSLATDVRSEVDKVREAGALARSQAELRAAESNLQALTEVSPAEVAVAEAEVMLAEARLLAKKTEAELSIVRAPSAGEVLRIDIRPGEPVTGGSILQLADLEHVKIVAEVDERLIEHIRVGEGADIKVRGGTQTYTAKVTRIGRFVMSANREPLDAATGYGGRFIEVDLQLAAADAIPRIAGLELSVTFKFPGGL